MSVGARLAKFGDAHPGGGVADGRGPPKIGATKVGGTLFEGKTVTRPGDAQPSGVAIDGRGPIKCGDRKVGGGVSVGVGPKSRGDGGMESICAMASIAHSAAHATVSRITRICFGAF